MSDEAPKRYTLGYITAHASELADYAENVDPSTMTETTTPEMLERWRVFEDRILAGIMRRIVRCDGEHDYAYLDWVLSRWVVDDDGQQVEENIPLFTFDGRITISAAEYDALERASGRAFEEGVRFSAALDTHPEPT